MNEYTKKLLVGILVAIVFVVCVAMVIVGHRNIGLAGLGVQMLGLAGLIVLLWLYNRQYK